MTGAKRAGVTMTSAHSPERDHRGCPYSYSCQRPGESAAAYQARVEEDINAGIAAEKRELGDRVNSQMWAVPFNDLAQDGTQPQSGTEPARWLQGYAEQKFAVVFVDGRTSRDDQHYRYEVHGLPSVPRLEPSPPVPFQVRQRTRWRHRGR
jgi:hypothetical protein